MRNLKKALALVLALMMTLSLMVTASASGYTDGSDIDYDEAVAVMSAIGVFNGTDGGKFDPDGNLTRAQAAKIITYMLLGQTVADSLDNTGSQFTDCPNGRWYVGAVNYLTDLGVISGRNATTFDPNGKVTGLEFAKMLLGALGYDAQKEKLVGTASWTTNTAILARTAGLDFEMTTSVLNSNALTRQQACQMAFNAETSTVVYYDDSNSFDISTSDGTHIVSNSKNRDWLRNNTGKGYLATGNNNTMQFCEMYCPELKLDNTYYEDDCFGRNSNGRWMVGEDVALVRTAKTAAVFTSAVSAKDVKDALNGYKWGGSYTERDDDGNLVTKYWNPDFVTNGVKGAVNKPTTISDADDKNTVTGINEISKNGRLIEVYANDDKEINQIVVVDYTLQTLSRVSTAANGDMTYVFTDTSNANSSYKNLANGTSTKVVLEGEVAAGDVVTTVVDKDKAIHVYPTDAMTGVQTSFNSNSKVVTINGEKYAIADNTAVYGVKNADSANFKNGVENATYYLDINGFLVKSSVAAAADDFACIVGTYPIVYGGVDGYDVSAQVRAVLSNGTVDVFTLAVDQAGEAAEDGSYAKDDYICGDVKLFGGSEVSNATAKLSENIKDKVFQYEMDKDGKLVLSALAVGNNSVTKNENNTYAINAVGAGDVSESNKGYTGATSYRTYNQSTTVLMSSNTTFVLVSGTGAKTAATVVTGTSGLKLAANGVTGTAIITGEGTTGTAKVVFLGVAAPVAEIVDYVYIDNTKFIESVVNDANVREYEGMTASGETISVYGPASGANVVAAKGLYKYDEDNMVSSKSVAATEESDLTFVKDNKVNIYGYGTLTAAAGGTLLANAGNTKFYNITEETDVVYIDETANGWDKADCYVVLKSVASGEPTDVAAIFIAKAAPAPAPAPESPAPESPAPESPAPGGND